MKIILCICILVSFSFLGCSVSQNGYNYSNKASKNINLEYFVKNYNSSLNYQEQKKLVCLFREHYFRPWNINEFSSSKKDSMWQVNGLRGGSFKGENKLPLSILEKEELIKNSNFNVFGSLNKKAITIVNTSLKLFPTENPIFRIDEDFPFDFNQNSSLKANSPLLISHLSADKAWCYVQSSLAKGWVPIRDIAFVDKLFINEYTTTKLAVIIKEMSDIYSKNDNFLFKAKVATFFPIAKELKNEFLVYFPIKNENLNATLSTIKIKKTLISNYPLAMNKNNIYIIAKELLGEKYGWGGLYSSRDCSSMTRDFFMPFGIWLPRNSYSQSKYLNFYDIANLDNNDKEKTILQKAKPFESLIYLKGHIMLYIGEYQGDVYVMHNTWGLKSKTKCNSNDRKIYGKSIISNLYLGVEDESVYKEFLLINRILGVSNVNKDKLFNRLK